MHVSSLKGLLQSNLLLGTAALGAGILAAWLGTHRLEQRAIALEAEARQRYASSPYIVASRDIPRGQRLDASLLSVRSMPRAFAPADALGPEAAGLLLGGRAVMPIRRGTPVLQAALLPSNSREPLSGRLPEGMRAMTIQVDATNAISGHLEAGDTVDLFYSQARGDGAVLVPLMQRVPVLATGETTESRLQSAPDEPHSDFGAVTLLVSAADARRVILAEQTGRLTVLLRGTADAGRLDLAAMRSTELFAPPASRPGPAHALPFQVELLTGGNGVAPARSWLRTGEGA